ncbi:MAG: hypothetical protein PHV45_08885 [Desulfuromonas thiophila]|nr:hypothetical protein [Desulfuromonas thiophila]
MKRMWIALVVMLSMAAPALAVDFTFHGDLNHRFRLYTNQVNFFNGVNTSTSRNLIQDDENSDLMGEIKYRLWTEMVSDDGAIKGVYAIEVGGVEFGRPGQGAATGGGFSGDSVNVETRWAYTDLALAGGRAKIGLQTFTVNKFLWNETATGIDYKIAAGAGDLELAWMRGYEVVNTSDNNDFEDLDALYARYNLKPADGLTVGFFALWQTSDGKTASDAGFVAPTQNYIRPGGFGGLDLDLYTLGIDGTLTAGNFFANWDLMYQFGDVAEEVDFGGYFAHADVGAKMGKGKLMFTAWYASGDDDATDDDWDAFIATDIDVNSEYSAVLFEGYTDDDYFCETPYLLDKGMILFRLGYDHQATDKLKVGVAALYMMTAEDMEYVDNNGIARADDEIGTEIDAYVSYKLFSSTEVALQAGYLMTGDAMDYYEVDCDGSADEDIYILSSRLRYMF